MAFLTLTDTVCYKAPMQHCNVSSIVHNCDNTGDTFPVGTKAWSCYKQLLCIECCLRCMISHFRYMTNKYKIEAGLTEIKNQSTKTSNITKANKILHRRTQRSTCVTNSHNFLDFSNNFS